MIEWPLEVAIASGLFAQVIVSTDSEEVAAVARAAGASVPFLRPRSLSDDHASTASVVQHAVEWLDESGASPQQVCCLYPTAAFVRVEDLAGARDALTAGERDYVLAVTEYAHPIQRALTEGPAGLLEPLSIGDVPIRTQDLPVALHDAGQFCWGWADAYRELRPVFGGRTTGWRFPRWRGIDIDTPEDWQYAERLHAMATEL